MDINYVIYLQGIEGVTKTIKISNAPILLNIDSKISHNGILYIITGVGQHFKYDENRPQPITHEIIYNVKNE